MKSLHSSSEYLRNNYYVKCWATHVTLEQTDTWELKELPLVTWLLSNEKVRTQTVWLQRSYSQLHYTAFLKSKGKHEWSISVAYCSEKI